MSKVQQLQQQYLALNQELIKLRAWAEEEKKEEGKEGSSTSTSGHTLRVQPPAGPTPPLASRSTPLPLRSQAPAAASKKEGVGGCVS
jgi:hypothetical protein